MDSGYFLYLGTLYSFLVILVFRWSKIENLNPKITSDLTFLLMILGFGGARLFHVIFENPEIYQADPLRILQFWRGGFVLYGGALAATSGAYIYLLLHGEKFLPWADFFSPIAALGYAIGRGSCLIADCCYGKTCSEVWAINHRHPTQIYAMAAELLTFALLLKLKKSASRRSGTIFFVWIIGHSLGRLIMENYRDDFRGPAVFGFSVSTVISLILLVLAFGAWVSFSLRSRKI